MKKVLGIFGLAVGMTVASSANAAVLRMDFGGGASELTVALSQNFTIDVWLDRPNSEPAAVGGASFEINGDVSIAGISNSTSLPNWSAAGTIGALEEGLGALSHQFLVFANDGAAELPAAATSVLLGTITAHPTLMGSFPLVFNAPSNTAFFVARDGGNLFQYHNTYGADAVGSYAGTYVSFGLGSPAVGGSMVLGPAINAQPLTLHVVPEPAALALLGLGAIVALRRRVG